jgi:flagellar protein FlgJ
MSDFIKTAPTFMSKPVDPKTPEQKLQDVSKMYEKHFLGEMMRAMRSTVQEGGFVQANQAEKIFREQLDQEYVNKWGEQGGIGLSNLIYQQLVDKFGIQMGIRSPVAKPQGPIALTEKSDYTGHQFQHPGKKDAVSYRFDRVQNSENSDGKKMDAEVKAPWDGVLLEKKSLVDNQTMLEFGHDNGLKSQMVFKGGAGKLNVGERVQAGDTVGLLGNEAKSLYWSVEKGQQPGPETVSE